MTASSVLTPVLTALLLALGGQALAANQFVACRPGAKIFYVNGVLKTDEQEVAAAASLLGKGINHFSVTCVADVDYLYNPSDGLIADDLREAATQKAADLGMSFADALLQVGFAAFGLPSLLSDADQAAVRNQIAHFIQDTSLPSYEFTYKGVTYTTAMLVNDFRDRVLTELQSGTKTVLVAHSQGNFFANETYLAVQTAADPSVAQGLAVVNVANAAGTAPNGLWVTSDHDLWIALVPGAMPANFATEFFGGDLMGHGFVEIYLNRSLPSGVGESKSIAAQVMSLVQQALNALRPPVGAFYGSTSSSLFNFNPNTNVATLLGPFTYVDGATVPVWDIAVNPHGGPLYAISPAAVSTFDPSSRALARLPSSNLGGNALAFSADGELYGMGGSQIFRIDVATGAATLLPISLEGYSSSGDLAFDSNGDLFGTVTGSGGDYLVRIDVYRSTLNVIGPIGFSAVYGLYFSGGTLFGVTSSGMLIAIDQVTGIGQADAQLPLSDVTGLQ